MATSPIPGVGITPAAGGIFNERMELRFDPSGNVSIVAGTHSHGQGHATVYAQMVSEWLGVPFESVRVVQGDTDQVPFGRGTYAARSSMIGGCALKAAADQVVEQAKPMAAHLMEAAAEDIVQTDGGFAVAGVPDKKASWRQIAAAAYGGKVPHGMELGLQETAFFDPKREAWGFGAHLALVRIDRETGIPTLQKLVLVDDCGVVINPMILNGQIHGGVVQGIGQALYEHTVYDDQGQLLTGSFMDYAMPHSYNTPSIDAVYHPVPATTNPLGVKGCGEAGCAGALTSVMNAVVDALSAYGIKHIDMPATPHRVWKAIQDAQKKQ